MIRKRNSVLVSLFLVLFLLCSTSAFAGTFDQKPVRTLNATEAAPWEKIECLQDTAPGFVMEPFHPKCKQSHTALKKAFGTQEPSSNYFLLHYAPGYNKKTEKTPVLLVHGAGDHAFHAWCHPYLLEAPDPSNIEKPGIMQFLSQKGYPVFAITFSHPHGDNFLQAQQISNAIERIKTVLKGGDDFKVDIICHSKGAMSTRIYLSDLARQYDKYNWITPFRKDVQKCVFIASPLKGLDTSYRYYGYNLTVLTKDIGAPMAPTSIIFMGCNLDLKNYNEKFPGQDQMLHNWVNDGIGFSAQSFTPDMNLTMSAIYFGGMSLLASSQGIDAAIEKSGKVIDKLNETGLDPSVTAYVLAGTQQAIDHVSMGFWKIPIGEMADASDGVLFHKSATYTDGLKARGARVAAVKSLQRHHVGLTVWPDALNFIEGALSGRDTD